MNKGTSYMFVTGPKVVKTVTGEEVTQEQLGGASMHSTKSGVAHFVSETEEEGMAMIRKLLSYLPQNNLEDAPLAVCTDDIDRIESERRNGTPARTAAEQVANDTTIFCKRTRCQYRVLLSSPARRTGKTEACTKHSNR